MTYRLQFRRYALPFRIPVRNAHGRWEAREGLIVRLEDEAGTTGYGEAAPIPGFGGESAAGDEAACREMEGRVDDTRLDAVPVQLGCLRHALSAARLRTAAAPRHRHLGVAALLPAGRAALGRIEPLAGAGFRVFKWKVGVDDIDEELGLLDELCAVLPGGSKLRLDANGAWDRRRAERWLERCAERPVEFVEQPCSAEASQGAAGRSKLEDILLGLAGDYPTPVALDESLANDGDIGRWLDAGWPGVYVVKPLLSGDLAGVLARLSAARARVVFSSALETAVGAKTALQAAFAWPGEVGSGGATGSGPEGTAKMETRPPGRADGNREVAAATILSKSTRPMAAPAAVGFGVWPLFGDSRFDGPAAAPFLTYQDVERIDPEAVWTALS